jgi:hypothetical protein
MTTIFASRKLVTLINVSTVEPTNQLRLLGLLLQRALHGELSVRHDPKLADLPARIACAN